MPGNIDGYGIDVIPNGSYFALKSRINNHPISYLRGTLDSKFCAEAIHEGLEGLGKMLRVEIKGEPNKECRHSNDLLILAREGNKIRITHVYNSRHPLYVGNSMPYSCFLSLFNISEESKESSLSGVI